MSDIMRGIANLRRLAAEAETPVEQFARSIEAAYKYQAEIDAGNRSTQEEREKVSAFMEGLNGNINPDMTAGDICMKANVRHNRGTSQFAAKEKKRLLIEYKKDK